MLQSYLLLSRHSLLIFFRVTGWVFVSAILGDVVGIPIDTVSMSFIMYNFAIGGCLAIFWQGKIVKPIKKIFMDFYLISISILMAYIFSQFSQLGGELLVWSILVALAFYDLCAVLSPCGLLKLLLKVVSSDKEGRLGTSCLACCIQLGTARTLWSSFMEAAKTIMAMTTRRMLEIKLYQMSNYQKCHQGIAMMEPQKEIKLWRTIRNLLIWKRYFPGS